jgi:transmembrane sensor
VSPLRLPLRESLRDPVDEPSLARVWAGIDARLRRRRRPRRSPVWVALATAGAVAAAVSVTYVGRDPGPLRLANGAAVAAVDAPVGGAVMPLADGSRVELGDGARFDPLESSSTSFVGVLERGSASFDVHPGGPRRWRIECGLATVEVVGTRFSCERNPGRLRVAVQRGAVLVSGERIENRVRRLSAGESLVVEDAAQRPLPAPAPATAAMPEPEPEPEPGLGAVPAPATAADSRRAPELAPHHASRRPSVTELLALADTARLSGHPADAQAPLQRILSEFALDPQAPLAAFALGRLELDSLAQPRRAAIALNRALALGIPRSLREDVRARLVEAYARAGEPAAARAAADAYRREFPDGRYTKMIESRVAPFATIDR